MPPKNKGDKNIPPSCTGEGQEALAKIDMLLSKFDAFETRMVNIEQHVGTIEKKTKGIQAIEEEIAKIREESREQKVVVDDHSKSLDFMSNEIAQVKSDNKDLKEALDKGNKERKYLQSMCERLEIERKRTQEEMRKNEDFSKRDCLLFEGLTETTGEDCSKVIKDFMKDNLGISTEMKFQRCHRFGKQQESKNRPIIVRFLLFEEMQEVFRNTYKLKKSKFFVRGFYSELTTNRRSALAPLMSHMKREKGLKCSLINDAIACGSQRFTVQTAKKLEYCQTAVTKTDGNILAFAGQLSILSNFYECDIEIGGDKFNSVEQLFQCTKAELHNNSSTVKQIMSTDNPVQQKRLGGILKINDDTWD